ncbi:MAG TPA: carbohydrate porin [Hanamia sp.]|nr:carbohydrate porin [Hanamia sp.]
MKKIITLSLIHLFKMPFALAQTNIDSTKETKWTNHFQLTVISQSHLAFKSLYRGRNSLSDSSEWGATSITSTLFLGRKLWKGGAFYFNPEISGGQGLSSAVGVAGALNGETYRVGNPAPGLFIARAYFQQQIPLGNTSYENVEDDVNQIKDKVPENRITISAGKFAISDFYDDNNYSHDPRTQFLNWSLMSNGAWDYPANTRGYTFGIVTELITPKWVLSFSSVAVPKIANAPVMEYNITKAHSETFGVQRKIALNNRPGNIRFIISDTHSRAPSYTEGLKAIATNDTYLLNVISGKAERDAYGGKKFGLGFSADQELNNEIGIFMRAGWNDGKDATWAFTEIDQTLSAGISIKGIRWNRPSDVFGIASVINGISGPHRDFLEAGGYGFIIGDGKLNYGHEAIVEAYYNAFLSKFFWLTLDYQFVNNPAYNKDRGPVNVFAVRGHVAF